MRSPFQGGLNIVRFNWHFYGLAAAVVAGLLVVGGFGPPWLSTLAGYVALAVGVTTVVSLAVSHYVYDRSDLYTLDWLGTLRMTSGSRLVNINAGFDETSALLAQRYPQADLRVYDFYDPARHTEVSIERARRAYPPFPGTLPIMTSHIPETDNSVDVALLVLAAHEIRDEAERIQFFGELTRVLSPTGYVVVVEHLRDVPNFLAYTIGFLHFHSRRTWLRTFRQAGLTLLSERKITPFMSVFYLRP